MKINLFICVLLSMGFASFYSLDHPKINTAKKDADICKLQGAVFVENHPSFADYRVYVEETESFAKLIVYKEEASIYANEPGHWYFTDTRGFADFSVFIEDQRGFEDFTISYTEFRLSAGCK